MDTCPLLEQELSGCWKFCYFSSSTGFDFYFFLVFFPLSSSETTGHLYCIWICHRYSKAFRNNLLLLEGIFLGKKIYCAALIIYSITKTQKL